MKKRFALLLSLLMLCLTCFGATAESITPGTYTGSGDGFAGKIVLTVGIDETGVASVEVTEQNETPSIGGKAYDALIASAVEKKDGAVDTVAGATFTANGFAAALTDALNQAKGIKVEVSTETTLKDGTYSATVPSLIDIEGLVNVGEMTMEATFEGNKIVKIDVPAFTDTLNIGGMAFDLTAERVIANQSTAVDNITGATVSTKAFLNALDLCIEQAGGDPAAFKAREIAKDAPKTVAYETDIVVVGAGMAGLTAAIEAADLGAKVIVCEKQEVFGSSTTRSLGYVMAANTPMQKAIGIDDTVDAFYNDIYSLYKDDSNLDTVLLKKLCDDSTDLFNFLVANKCDFNAVVRVSDKGARATSRIHCSTGLGSGLINSLYTAAVEKGVTVLMGTPVSELILDETGTVIGVKASNKNGDDITVTAQSTIMAAGSYTENAELLAELNPKMDNIEVLTGCGDGAAYYMFKQAGADIVHVDYIQMMYYFFGASWGTRFPEKIPGSPTVPNYDVLMVDGAGYRVASEDDFCFEYVNKLWNAGYSEGYAIYGQTVADMYPIMTDLGLTTKTARDLPFGYKADTLEELAGYVGMDPAVVKATVERYNELCAKGVDEDFQKNPANMIPIEAPYYVLRLPQICTDGYTGARINDKAQVISTEGNPIPGLYAAGSCADAQVTSVNYNGCGTSLLTCGVFGRAAAQDAVSKLVK